MNIFKSSKSKISKPASGKTKGMRKKVNRVTCLQVKQVHIWHTIPKTKNLVFFLWIFVCTEVFTSQLSLDRSHYIDRYLRTDMISTNSVVHNWYSTCGPTRTTTRVKVKGKKKIMFFFFFWVCGKLFSKIFVSPTLHTSHFSRKKKKRLGKCFSKIDIWWCSLMNYDLKPMPLWFLCVN